MSYARKDDFCLGEWRVQPRLNRIQKQEEASQIEPKMMQVLVHLAAHAGDVCTRQALLEAAWHGTVVGDEVLSRVISELRKVFGDDARNPEVIETIPRVGYRLIIAVSPCDDTTDTQHGQAIRPESSQEHIATPLPASAGSRTDEKNHAHRWLWSIALVGVATLITGLIAHYQARDEPFVVVSTTPLTTLPGLEIDPALSPDGNRIAFVWTGPGNNHLDVFTKAVGTEELLQLTDTPFYEYSPVWSPDGSQIAFARSLEGIFVISALGGPERKVASIGTSSIPQLAWSPTGNVLLFTDRESARHPYRLMQLNLNNGEVTPLTNPPAAYIGDRSPAISPDGAWIAFARESDRAAEVYVVSSTGGPPRRLTRDHADLSGLTWTADGDAIVFASSRDGSPGLWQVGIDGEAPERIPYGGTAIKDPVIQGDRLAFVQVLHEVNIWQQDLTEPDSPARLLLASTQEDSNPQFAPDGRSLVFVSSRSGYKEIWKGNADGTELVQLTHFKGGHVSSPRWSPDGQHIAFDARLHGQPDIFIISAHGNHLERLTEDDARDVIPSWSKDGRSIYFSSNRSGTWEVWKQPVSGSAATQVTTTGAFAGRVSPDGKTLYFSGINPSGLWSIPIAGGIPKRIWNGLTPDNWGHWDVRREHVYYVRSDQGRPVVMRYNARHETTEQVGTLTHYPLSNQMSFSISPDGKKVLLSRTDLVRFDLTIAELNEN